MLVFGMGELMFGIIFQIGYPSQMTTQFESIDQTQSLLWQQGYVCDRSLATVVFLALKLGWPLF